MQKENEGKKNITKYLFYFCGFPKHLFNDDSKYINQTSFLWWWLEDAEYYGFIALSVAKKPSGPSQTNCYRHRFSYKHDTFWQCWGETWKCNQLFCMLIPVQKKCKCSGRNHSILCVSWCSSWSADHASIGSLWDFNSCIRTYLHFAVFPPKLFLHKVNTMLLLSLLFLSVWFSWSGCTGFIYSHVSINIISVKWLALILASELVTRSLQI